MCRGRCNVYGVKVSPLVLSAVILTAPQAHAAEMISVAHQDDLAWEEEILVEALRIYTRNLGCDVRVEGVAPAYSDDPRVDELRGAPGSEGPDYLLWASRRRDGGLAYYTLDGATNDLRETPIGVSGPETAAQEVALKIRVTIASRRRRSAGPGAAAARPDVPPPETKPVVEIAVPVAAIAREARVADEAMVSQTAGDAKKRSGDDRSRFELGAGIGLVSPRDRTWLRTGFVLDAAVRLGPGARVWAYAESALTSQPQATIRGFDMTLRDVPVTAGARVRLSMKHGSVVVGSRTSLHILDVTAAAPDGRRAASRTYSFGLGGVALAELNLGYHAAVFLGLTTEGLMPSHDFTIAGRPALATSAFLYGATGGLHVALP
jgi:hypothetical protein